MTMITPIAKIMIIIMRVTLMILMKMKMLKITRRLKQVEMSEMMVLYDFLNSYVGLMLKDVQLNE